VTERRLDRSFFARDALEVAPDLLGKVFVVGSGAGRIVEVEAYRADDPASHSYRGRTARNATMFGEGGMLYVYFTYGMHHCANIVTGGAGDGQAVLLRALLPLRGIDEMRARRGRRTDASLADGPGKLCQALGLDRSHDGIDLCTSAEIFVADDGTSPPAEPIVGGRVGIRHGVEHLWRWRTPIT
jgi:DNA-3-methyladenine glycosylase